MSRRIEYMCPHCGWKFDAAQCKGLVPPHMWERGPKDCIRCPGSEQAPRNPDSDRRPLWKDMTPEKEEAMQWGPKEFQPKPHEPVVAPTASHEALVAEAICRISKGKTESNPTVVLPMNSAAALLRELEGLRELADKYADAFAKAEQVQAALEVTMEGRDVLAESLHVASERCEKWKALVRMAMDRWKPDDLSECAEFMRKASEMMGER